MEKKQLETLFLLHLFFSQPNVVPLSSKAWTSLKLRSGTLKDALFYLFEHAWRLPCCFHVHEYFVMVCSTLLFMQSNLKFLEISARWNRFKQALKKKQRWWDLSIRSFTLKGPSSRCMPTSTSTLRYFLKIVVVQALSMRRVHILPDSEYRSK